MTTLAVLWFACASVGLPGSLCQAVSQVESGLGRNVNHASEHVRGLMGVDHRYSPLPRWALDTTVGGAVGGAIALCHWQKAAGAHFIRAYACGNKHTARACRAYEQRVRAVLARMKQPKEALRRYPGIPET